MCLGLTMKQKILFKIRNSDHMVNCGLWIHLELIELHFIIVQTQDPDPDRNVSVSIKYPTPRLLPS